VSAAARGSDQVDGIDLHGPAQAQPTLNLGKGEQSLTQEI
jgi:hypothetical protein